MPAAYGPEHAELAQTILGRALEELMAAGLDGIESCHSLIHQGLDLLPAFVCRHHLAGELEAVIEATEDRLAEIPSLRPGIDVAACAADVAH